MHYDTVKLLFRDIFISIKQEVSKICDLGVAGSNFGRSIISP